MDKNQVVDAIWDSLREVACTTGLDAVRIVQIHRHDIKEAIDLVAKRQPEVLEQLSQRVT